MSKFQGTIEQWRGWHPITIFATLHRTQCSAPTYLRGFLWWHPWLAEWARKSEIGGFISWLVPMWCGAKVLVCLECRTTEFQNKWAKKLYMWLNPVDEQGKSLQALVFLACDVSTLSDEERERYVLEEEDADFSTPENNNYENKED